MNKLIITLFFALFSFNVYAMDNLNGLGDAEAQYKQGDLALGNYGIYGYAVPDGDVPDYSEARQWFKKAAAQGHVDAHNRLGELYLEGLGVRQDVEKAKKWFEKAADKGNADAQYTLGKIYYRQAFEQYSLDVHKYQTSLDVHKTRQSAKQILAVHPGFLKAKQWYEKAAAQGFEKAQYELGSIYYQGLGVRQDNLQAKEWFGKACNNGYKNACAPFRDLNTRKNSEQ